MKRCFKWVSVGLMALGAVVGLAGCPAGGPAKHYVKGKLLDNGTPLKIPSAGLPPGDKGVQLTFLPLKDGQVVDTIQANVDPQAGTFDVPGPDGKGLPAGKYKVTLRVGPYGSADVYKDAFAQSKTPFNCEITGPTTVVIDVAKKTVTLE